MSVISRYHFVDVKCSANKRYGSQKVIMNVTSPQKIPLYHAVLRDSGAKQINGRGSAELKYDENDSSFRWRERLLGFLQECHPCEIILLEIVHDRIPFGTGILGVSAHLPNMKSTGHSALSSVLQNVRHTDLQLPGVHPRALSAFYVLGYAPSLWNEKIE